MVATQPTEAEVREALADFKDPETGRGVVEMGQVSDIRSDASGLSLTLALSTHSAPLWKDCQTRCAGLLRSRFSTLSAVTVNLAIHARPPEKIGEIGLTAKSVIAVGSGKGGVGKSTIAASAGLGLSRAGCEGRPDGRRRLRPQHPAPARRQRNGRDRRSSKRSSRSKSTA